MMIALVAAKNEMSSYEEEYNRIESDRKHGKHVSLPNPRRVRSG